MVSLKQIVQCIGLSGDVSIRKTFYGYWATRSRTLMLVDQVRLLQGPHIHLNIIFVGVEAFTKPEREAAVVAVRVARDLFSTVGFGIGRVIYWAMSQAEAGPLDVINQDSEAHALAKRWVVQNDGIDVFLVRDQWACRPVPVGCSCIGGLSPCPGPCEKNTDKELHGLVVALAKCKGSLDVHFTGISLAHEIGHYLGLACGHDPEADNLMFAAPVVTFEKTDERGRLVFESPTLRAKQGEHMKRHCAVQRGC